MHFYEALERKIDFNQEYQKLEYIAITERVSLDYSTRITIEEAIETFFRNWKKRKNYTSFMELRRHLGFSYQSFAGELQLNYATIKEYYLYCEMMLNLLYDLRNYFPDKLTEKIKQFKETIEATLELTGAELKNIAGAKGIIIITKNPAAIEVATIQPKLSDLIVEYNQYLLKGNLGRKKELLKAIADALEPKRKGLETRFSNEVDTFFYMANNMNVRHNNVTPNSNSYNEKFVKLTPIEQEALYDKMYELGLLLFLLEHGNQMVNEIREFRCN